MVDRRAFVRAAADYADALLTHYDVGTVLYRLTDHVVDVLGADGAAVCLARDGEQLAFVAATDGHVAEIEQLQLVRGQGPCHDAYLTGQVIAVDDLTDEGRWPDYRGVAVEEGARAVLGMPMPVGEQRLGALNVYRYAPHEWDDEEVEVARVLADMATGYIVNHGELERSTTLASQLQHALDTRILIEQAKGILAERNQIPVAEAFDRMRKHARHNQIRIHDLAEQIIAETPPCSGSREERTPWTRQE